MKLNNCCSSSNSRNSSIRNYVRRSGYGSSVSFGAVAASSKMIVMPRWRMLWIKIKKEKKRLFDCSTYTPVHLPYDPYTYAQNFDQGSNWADPDNLSRSFSARFAVPSRILKKGGLQSEAVILSRS
ncbi:uncharacterized protein LOC107404700 [Ziziphus jujuba]|uniref:Uncharacterized protein LOC107404700 n=1 Tax=Ziziphus jujuba TaxID=326968 RepID=A0ABM4A183_ZIZJJ|nr:uncharacterized protein LOC107404700 [Ziziphus jujuba]